LPDDRSLVAAALGQDRYATARLISLFEDTRSAAESRRAQVIDQLDEIKAPYAPMIGLTGTPGAGKSTLLSALAHSILARNATLRLGILAIDPTSQISKGALLGDRTRLATGDGDDRLFFRSQASALDLGGLGRDTYAVSRLMVRLFDLVFIETVGIGQSETDIRQLVDRTYLVLQPAAGDEIQFMKAGIMEIPDAFIVNKSDLGNLAQRTATALKTIGGFAVPGENQAIPVCTVSAQNGDGVETLAAEMATCLAADHGQRAKSDCWFFRRWLRYCYGQWGLDWFERSSAGGVEALIEEKGYDRAIIFAQDLWNQQFAKAEN